MNKYTSAFFILFALFQAESYCQTSKTSFYEGPYADVQNEAIRTKKFILLDFTSPLCKYCLRMEKEVFENAEVSTLINKDFIAYKVDLQDPDGKQLVTKYKVNEFPEYVILNDKNIVVGSIKGEHKVSLFLEKVQNFITKPSLETNKPIKKSKKRWMFWKK